MKMEKILRGMILEGLREAGRLQPITSEAGRKKAADPYSTALQSLIGLTKAALEGGMTGKYLGQSREATREILEKIMIPWIKQNYDYLESNSTSFGESTQMLSALTGPAGKKVFKPEFAAHFGKAFTPENKELAFKVRDMIKNNLITGFIINGSRAFWKLHLIAVGELLGKNPPQLKARNPQEQENYEAEKQRFKRDFGDIVTGSSLEEGEELNEVDISSYVSGAMSHVRSKFPKTYEKFGYQLMEIIVTDAVEDGIDEEWGEESSTITDLEADYGVGRKTLYKIFKVCQPYAEAYDKAHAEENKR